MAEQVNQFEFIIHYLFFHTTWTLSAMQREWQCVACTVMNVVSILACVMCGTRRPRSCTVPPANPLPFFFDGGSGACARSCRRVARQRWVALGAWIFARQRWGRGGSWSYSAMCGRRGCPLAVVNCKQNSFVPHVITCPKPKCTCICMLLTDL